MLLGSLVALAAITMACTPRPSNPGASVPIVASPTISGSGLVTPTLTPTPARTDGASPVVVALEEDVELFVGGSAAVEGMDVTLTLLDARGPEAGCSDCPNHVRLRVACPAGPAELEFAFSGGMDPAAMERARRQAACGLEFYIVEVHEGRATVRVLSPD